MKKEMDKKYIIKKYSPLTGWLVVILIGLLSSGFTWFMLSEQYQDCLRERASTIENTERINRNNTLLNEKNTQLQNDIIHLNRNIEIDKIKTVDLQKAIRSLQDESYKLKGELEFYEQIISAQTDTKGISVQGLRIEALDKPLHYLTKVILTHYNRKNGSLTKGVLELSIEGEQGDKLKKLSLKDISVRNPPEAELAFQLTNFKRIESAIILPENFEPLWITVKLVIKSKKSSIITKRFNWSDTFKQAGETNVWSEKKENDSL